MTETTASPRTWYIKDEPLSNLPGQDSFGHTAYVDALVTTIDELSPPFTLGVFGSWGVGKSSIINDLSGRLNESSSSTRAVTIDVWKYSDDSLRRQFLFDLQHELKEKKALDEGTDYVQEIYTERTAETQGKQRFDFTRLKALFVPLLFTFLLTLASIGLLQLLDIATPLEAVLAALVAPAALFFVAEFSRKLEVESKDIVTRPVYFSEDQFERKFKEIVSKAKCGKLVIIVDNLDRCSHELVVETLSAIKTFLEPKGEKCVFVIPCDDNAIRQHIRAAYRVFSGAPAGDDTIDAEPYAAEYLRKFFSASIKIDPFLPEEIEPYIEQLLRQMKIIEAMPDQEIGDLVQMVGLLFRENPRQLKQFLNNLTSKFLVARAREAGPTPQINPPITGNKLFLAKVVAIETRFPKIYERFSSDDNLFPEVHLDAVTPSRETEASKRLGLNGSSALLEDFLRTTGHITADNPKAFFHLKQSEQEARIPNYTQFEMALRQGDVETAQRAYADGNPTTNEARTEILIRRITEWSQKGYLSYALNATRVAIAARGFPESDTEHISREVVRALATIPRLLGSIHQLQDPHALLDMSECALAEHCRTVQDANISLLSSGSAIHQPGQSIDSHLEDLVAGSLVQHLDSLQSGQKNRIRTAMAERDQVRPELLDVLSSTPQARNALIDSTTLSKAVERISLQALADTMPSASDAKRSDLTFEVLIRCQDEGDSILSDATAEKLSEALQFAASNGLSELFMYISEVASRLSTLLDTASQDPLARVIASICDGYPSVEEEHRALLVRAMLRHYGGLPEEQTTRIDEILTSEHIPSAADDQLTELLALHKESSFASAPWELVTSEISRRIAAEADDSESTELMDSVVSVLAPDDVELLMLLAVAILEEAPAQRTVPLVRRALAILPKGNGAKSLALPVLEATLSLDGHAGEPDSKGLLLELVLQYPEFHTKDFEAKLDDHLVQLFREGESFQQVSWDALQSAHTNGAMSADRYMAILSAVTDWLTEQPASTALQQPLMEVLDEIVRHKDIVLRDDAHKETLIRWLSARLEEHLPADEQQQTLKHLTSFRQLPVDILRDLVPSIVSQAENSPDDPIRGVIDTVLLDLFSANNPLDYQLWNPLHEYRLRLLKSNGSQLKIGRKLDREMRKIRQNTAPV